jgi:murein DD-endopeptidase MepM/ murein hydrolase activator NlpD
VTWPRPGARRLIGAGLLLPGLLLSHPLDTAAETSTVKTPPKRIAAKELPSKTQSPKAPPAKKLAAKTQPVKTPLAKTPLTKNQPVKKIKTGASAATPSPDERCVHLVLGGDTVFRVAAQYHAPREGIITGNQLGAAGTLKVGQRISVPGCKKGGGLRAEAPRQAPAVELENGLFLARVGPNRIPTRLFVAVPEFGVRAIEFAWPVEGMLASGFGKRRMGWHAGIDIKADMGTPVLAAAGGTVSFSGWSASYGRLVKIQHPNGFVTVYAHNSENLVQIGDEVEAGRMIATVGRSGRASDHHLHFEIRRDEMAFNPLFLLEGRDHTPVFASTLAEPLETAELLDEEVDDDVRE